MISPRAPLLAASILLAACGEQGARSTASDAPLQAQALGVVPDPGPTRLVHVPAGEFEPLFPGRDAPARVSIAAFELEQHAVTNAQFAAFVAAERRWRRSLASKLFVDDGYLGHWANDLDPGAGLADRPVTNVSWFAARAYARWRDRRLPTQAEWEVAAARPLVDGSDPGTAVLEWYGKPSSSALGPVGSGARTSGDLQDLHGLVWEWVDDFANAMGTGDARSATDLQRSLFCGAGAVGAARPEDYAAFMRYAMRSSLTGARTTRNLGFRCARDVRER